MENISIFILKDKILFEILKEIKFLSSSKIHYIEELSKNSIGIINKDNNPKVLILNIEEKAEINLESILSPKICITKKPFNKIKKSNIAKEINLPIKIHELVSQIKFSISKNEYVSNSFIRFSKYILDFNERIVTQNGKSLKLTEKEVEFIVFLKNEKKPINIIQLLDKVWKYKETIESHTVETHVHRLRKKFYDVFKDDNLIKSNQKGYYLNI